MRRSLNLSNAILGLSCACSVLLALTAFSIQPPVLAWRNAREASRVTLLDRNGLPLSASYGEGWNADTIPLYRMPERLRQAFLFSEDKRFYEHSGVDWRARFSAVWQDIRHGRRERGASTISEQAVRLLHPRARTLWAKWLEGFEASGLERTASKDAILEFYLNQLPYAGGRRGVRQAAQYYFSRDLDTLNLKETLALVVLARAPSAFDPYRKPGRLDKRIRLLAQNMEHNGLLETGSAESLDKQTLALYSPSLPVEAPHFLRYARQLLPVGAQPPGSRLRTTLDAHIQQVAQQLLSERLKAMQAKGAHNAGILVADHSTGDILAWAAGGEAEQTPGWQIDPVVTPRQPGSALKPFLYAAALDSGWSPATLIQDAPLSESIGGGLHRFRNYSHIFYGQVTLRQALGNSLNIPALHTIAHIGVERYLGLLHSLGFNSLSRGAHIYDDGLALGDGEVTLLELAQGYAALAQGGRMRPLHALPEETQAGERVFSPEAATLIGNILSDPWARNMEFGTGSILNLPVQTAVKTGTSTDYRDAWAVGYNYRYVVAVWMGNLDQKPMDGITGSVGPALTLRAMFSELTRHERTRPLPLSARLEQREVCLPVSGGNGCWKRSEYSMPGQEIQAKAEAQPRAEVSRPSEGLMLAIDPRLPRALQAFEFRLAGYLPGNDVEWILDGSPLARTQEPRYSWNLARGKHVLSVAIWQNSKKLVATEPVHFLVK